MTDPIDEPLQDEDVPDAEPAGVEEESPKNDEVPEA